MLNRSDMIARLPWTARSWPAGRGRALAGGCLFADTTDRRAAGVAVTAFAAKPAKPRDP